MQSMLGVYGKELVHAYQQDLEREFVRREQQRIAKLHSESLIAKTRRFAGAFVIGIGKVIQGRQVVEPTSRLNPLNFAS